MSVDAIDEMHQIMRRLDAALGDSVYVRYGADNALINTDPRNECYLVLARDWESLGAYRSHPEHLLMLDRLHLLGEMTASEFEIDPIVGWAN